MGTEVKLSNLSDEVQNNLKAGRKNAIINGDFAVWQRAITQTATGYGSDDRWRNDILGTTQSITRETFTLGQTDVPNNPKYFFRNSVTTVAGAGNYSAKIQRIEGVNIFAGETITLSFWAKADATKNMAVEFVQHFGTSGSPSANVSIGSQLVALTTSWVKQTITVAIPSITGKTLGTDNNDVLSLNFWFDAGSNFDAASASLGQQSGIFDIAQVQLEKGSIATDFEKRSFGEELSLCQRYYEKGKVSGRAYVISTDTFNYYITFSANKRVVPTLTQSNVVSSNSSGGTVDIPSLWGLRWTFQATATGGTSSSADWTADAEL